MMRPKAEMDTTATTPQPEETIVIADIFILDRHIDRPDKTIFLQIQDGAVVFDFEASVQIIFGLDCYNRPWVGDYYWHLHAGEEYPPTSLPTVLDDRPKQKVLGLEDFGWRWTPVEAEMRIEINEKGSEGTVICRVEEKDGVSVLRPLYYKAVIQAQGQPATKS